MCVCVCGGGGGGGGGGGSRLIDYSEKEQQQQRQQNHTRTKNTRWGARYLRGYTEKEKQQQQNRTGKEREGGVSTETEREVAGFVHAKVRGVANLRHLENTEMSHLNPEAQ